MFTICVTGHQAQGLSLLAQCRETNIAVRSGLARTIAAEADLLTTTLHVRCATMYTFTLERGLCCIVEAALLQLCALVIKPADIKPLPPA